MEFDERSFWLMFRALDIRSRTKVALLATLGLRASDSETAWLVAMFAPWQLRLQAIQLVLGLAVLGTTVWLYVQVDRFPLQLWFGAVAGVVLVASVWTHRRAVRVNEPGAARSRR